MLCTELWHSFFLVFVYKILNSVNLSIYSRLSDSVTKYRKFIHEFLNSFSSFEFGHEISTSSVQSRLLGCSLETSSFVLKF